MVEAFQMVMGLFRQFLKGDILICFIWTIASTLFLPWNYIASTLFFALGKESLEDRDVNCPSTVCDNYNERLLETREELVL